MKITDLKERYGQWALITGASSGIGKAFAYGLSNLGVNVFLIARREERLQVICEEINTAGKAKAEYLILDLTDSNFEKEILEVIKNLEIGILINNAGIGANGEFMRSELNYDLDMLNLHCTAPLKLTHAVSKQMIKNNRGAIVFIGSVLGSYPAPYAALYSATKAFNSFYAQAISYELKYYGIDVLCISPGSTNTELKRLNKSSSKILTREPEQVFKTFLKNIGKRSYVIDGILNNAIATLVNLLAQRIKIKFVGKAISKIK